MKEEASTLKTVPSDIGLKVHKPPAIKKAEKVSVPVKQNALEICKIRIAWAKTLLSLYSCLFQV